ncbi:MAG: ATP-binding protein [Paracoccaceae bacterium]
MQSGMEGLALYGSRNSEDGLFRRYAAGRLRQFWNRQVIGLSGAAVVGLTLSGQQGLFIGAIILLGEAVDCLVLMRILRRSAKRPVGRADRAIAVASGLLQTATLIQALALCSRLSSSDEMDFFILSILAGISINVGVARPYFTAASNAKLSMTLLAAIGLVAQMASSPAVSSLEAVYVTAAAAILAASVTMFIGQTEKAFARQQQLERSMAMRNDDLRRSREELDKSGALNRRLALAARHANDAIVFLDAENRYQWVNEAFTRITGYTEQEAIGRHPGEILNAPETSAETLEQLEAARRTRSPIRVDIYNRNKGGQGFWVDTSIIPIRDESGAMVVSLAIERDITEAKEREAELARAKQAAEAAAMAKSRFLANMSHEIRTPLNGVIGVAELLAETRLTRDQRTYVETVLDSGRALLRMVNDVLDLSKLQAGKGRAAQEAFDLLACAEGVMRLLQPEARRKGLTLSLHLGPGLDGAPLRVMGDQDHLRQILVNLLGNALKFTETGGVSALIRRQGDETRIEVTDTGIGIGAENLPAIFDSFTQADETISRRFGGTGLGLTISAMLARQMNGTIEATSQPGKGSTFALTLPLPAAGVAVAPARAPEPPRGQAQTAGLRVLVAEDNRTNMMILRKALGGHIAELIEAVDGRAAVQAWADEGPDLILMDVSMPVMDGMAAVREIRRQEAASGRPRCPVLALTALSQAEDRAACQAAGFDGFLVKPLRRDDLLRAMAEQLSAADSPPPARRA